MTTKTAHRGRPLTLGAAAALCLGLTLAIVLIAASNVREVVAAMRPLGVGGFVVVTAVQLLLAGLLGLAWWTVAPRPPPARISAFVWAGLMAEAAANVLPFTQVGGAVLATRAAIVAGVRPSIALGSNVADVTLEIVAQCLFTLTGLALVLARVHGGRAETVLIPLAFGGLMLGVGLAAALIGAQKWGLRLVALIAKQMNAQGRTAALEHVFQRIYAQPWRLAAGIGLHVVAWFGTAGATWLILVLMGRPLPFMDVVAMESLQFALRGVAFFAPLGLGVQEGAYAVLGPLFGLPLQAALALSLLKRARDLAIGAPVLVSWQVMEARRRFRRRHP